MTTIKKLSQDMMEDYESYEYAIIDNCLRIGCAVVIAEENDEHPYIESIVIDEEYRNQGHGTDALYLLSREFGGEIYVAPDNEDAQRLYERIGTDGYDWEAAGYIDQGYGVYKI